MCAMTECAIGANGGEDRGIDVVVCPAEREFRTGLGAEEV